jgi:hypothetical protein
MEDKEYVSFETAKALKSRGFNELCEVMITENGTLVDYNYNDQNSKEVYSLPYVEDVVKWLEKNFHYYIARIPRIKNGEVTWTYQVFHKESNDLLLEKTFNDVTLNDTVRWCLDDNTICIDN